MSKIRLGEPPFISIQGEFKRTGYLSNWLRLFGCSIRCPGFFQKDPADPSTYVDPLEGVNPKQYKTIFELPVVEYGCDSIYSVDPRFKHCAYDYESAADLVDEILNLMPGSKFKHPVTGQTYDWCVTGGEPLMHQDKVIELYEEMYNRDAFPYDIQFETNCTRALTPSLINLINETRSGRHLGKTEWHVSMSPKLFYVSGEKDAFQYDNIKQYVDVFGANNSWLKIVINADDRSWNEFDNHMSNLRDMGIRVPVSVMPVGATADQQADSTHLAPIANKAIQRGYHVSGRIHANIWGNTPAT